MPLVHLSAPVVVAIDIAAWGVVHAVSGYAVHTLPVRRLSRDGRLFAPRRLERDGRLYVDTLRIKRWKDRVPEAGALFAGGVSKRHLPDADAGGLERFAVETRRAELGHWLAMLPAPLFAIWNPPVAAAVIVVYGIGINLPFIAIQRYNRLRVARVLRSRASRAETAARSRNERGTNGTSIP
ncbi:MAG: glycosyl-4,4'-diaponeurosporenoate acyltransferase [Acidimicrobiia bacterium]